MKRSTIRQSRPKPKALLRNIVKHPKGDSYFDAMRVEMEDILERIKAGKSFEESAGENSDCPENSGSLGSFARGTMVQEFEDVVFNLEPGQSSDVFTTQFGFHIAKVTDKKSSIACELADVKEIIVRELRQELEQKAIDNFIDSERKKAVIEDK